MKKGFTLIELLAVIVILGFISTIAVASYSSYMEHAEKEYYEKAEKTMKGGAESLITYCASSVLGEDYCVDIPQAGTSVSIPLSTLVKHDFVAEITDQQSGELCGGDVTINSKEQNSQNYQFEYKICLSCTSYKSSDCK